MGSLKYLGPLRVGLRVPQRKKGQVKTRLMVLTRYWDDHSAESLAFQSSWDQCLADWTAGSEMMDLWKDLVPLKACQKVLMTAS